MNPIEDRMSYPVVRYVIQRGDRFVADDRHSDYDAFRTDPITSPFVCEWDTPEQASEQARPGDEIRMTIDGALIGGPITPHRLAHLARIRAALDAAPTGELVPWAIDDR